MAALALFRRIERWLAGRPAVGLIFEIDAVALFRHDGGP
jgi:hypothetical protein